MKMTRGLGPVNTVIWQIAFFFFLGSFSSSRYLINTYSMQRNAMHFLLSFTSFLTTYFYLLIYGCTISKVMTILAKIFCTPDFSLIQWGSPPSFSRSQGVPHFCQSPIILVSARFVSVLDKHGRTVGRHLEQWSTLVVYTSRRISPSLRIQSRDF